MTTVWTPSSAQPSTRTIRRVFKTLVFVAVAFAAWIGAISHSAAQVSGAVKALKGFVDMHTHPMSNLAFGGKLIHGAPDVGALIPADSHCRHNVRAISWQHALEVDNATHGGWGFDNGCGDYKRALVIDLLQLANEALVTPDYARGFPDFANWPAWNDITHQKMYIDWIKRAHSGGLSVLVALATNNATLAASVMGPGDGPQYDRASADLQLIEMHALVNRNKDFMEIAKTSADLRRIVGDGKLAVVLGVELDNIGDFQLIPSVAKIPGVIQAELKRLYDDRDVRYIFPVHLVDNLFGGTAVYKRFFNYSNAHIAGHFWKLVCSDTADSIAFDYYADPNMAFMDVAFSVVAAPALGIGLAVPTPNYPHCVNGRGHVNSMGLTPLGQTALKEMMKLGMLIDIDHMSQIAANQALNIAEGIPRGGYPLNSGHNAARSARARQERNENTRTRGQIQRIAKLGGMFGVGSADLDAPEFIKNYEAVALDMNNKGVGFGTDFNGLVKGMRPRAGSNVIYDASFPASTLGSKTWNYNTEGVAHYGMLPDFIRDLQSIPGGAEVVKTLFHSAEDFAQTWERAEKQKAFVN